MDHRKVLNNRLFVSSVVDNKDDFEEKLERSYNYLQKLISGLTEKEQHDILHKEKNYEDISLGLVYTILIEPQHASKAYRDLTLITRDGFSLITLHLSQLILERYLKLQDAPRGQLIWFVREMIRNAVTNVDSVCWNLMRQAAGGDLSAKNLHLIESLLDTFQECRSWLEKFPVLLASVVYTFLRLLEDHQGPNLQTLRQKEINFLISVIRERFSDCLVIGRDLVRLLQNVARIPEFDQLWRDMFLAPKNLCQNFTGILQLMQTRTSRRFLQSRLTPDMERKLVFLTSQVRFGHHKRYQDWFQKQYLATPESQTLRCDMIRFIVAVIHPTNELLCSDIIPRWAIIGWLLTTCTSAVASANAKLALFYDWLFFDQDKDNIMNIEPAILVMHNSMRSHPSVTATLLDFLCRIMNNFCPSLADRVRTGIHTSLRQILEKRVLPMLYPLFDSTKLDRELRLMVRETFKEFYVVNNNNNDVHMNSTNFLKDEQQLQTKNNEVFDMDIDMKTNHRILNNHIDTNRNEDPAFSDDELLDVTGAYSNKMLVGTINGKKDVDVIDVDEEEDDDEDDNVITIISVTGGADDDDDDLPLSKVKLKKDKMMSGGGGSVPAAGGSSSNPVKNCEEHFDAELKLLLNHLKNEKSNEHMEAVVSYLLKNFEEEENDDKNADEDDEMITNLANVLLGIFENFFLNDIFPKSKSDDHLLKSVQDNCFFVIFRHFYKLFKNDDDRRLKIINLISEMYNYQKKIGYLLLYFLKVMVIEEKRKDPTSDPKNHPFKASVYKEFCQGVEKRIDLCLLENLMECQLHEPDLLTWLVPEIYKEFRAQIMNNVEILRTVLQVLDTKQLNNLMCLIVQGKLTMLKSDSIYNLLQNSLEWETFEQFCLWYLIQAHHLSIDSLVVILPQLNCDKHSEAMSSLLLMLKNHKPNADCVKYLFARESSTNDLFVVTILKHWCQDYSEKLAELISNLINSRCAPETPNKRKRNKSSTSIPNGNQVLSHLSQFRSFSTAKSSSISNLFNTDNIKKALRDVYQNCSKSQRKSFSNLFTSVIHDEDDSNKKSSGRGRKPASASSNSASNTVKPSSSSSSSTLSSSSASNRNKIIVETLTDFSDSSEEEEVLKPQRATKKRKKDVLYDSD